MKRRTFNGFTAALIASSATGVSISTFGESVFSENMFPSSSGSELPKLKVPNNACNSHIHVIDQRFAPGHATQDSPTDLDAYLKTKRRLGITRTVVVQPKYHGTDPSCLLNALERLGSDARGIAVALPSVTDAELQRLHAGGVRGLRFSVWDPVDTVTTIQMIEPLASRIADLGWHAELHMSGQQIVENAALLRQMPCSVVFDHMGRLPPQEGPAHPAFKIIAEMIDRGKTWVTLSGPYLNTVEGPPYRDATKIAKAFAGLAPERITWGSDWPHPTESRKPDDAELLDMLAVWVESSQNRLKVLVDNPARLYDFK